MDLDDTQENSIYTLNFCKAELHHVLQDAEVSPHGHNLCKFIVVYMDRLYSCSGEKSKTCQSWDINSGEKEIHAAMNTNENEWLCHFSYVEINDKIWITGGWHNDAPSYGIGNRTKLTSFLHPNFTWTQGPELPESKMHHSTVALDEHKVAIFGGYASAEVWIYDDVSMTFDIKKPYDIGEYTSVIKIKDFKEINKDVLLVRSADKMLIYDWKMDYWFKLDSSWNVPSLYYLHTTFFQMEER